MLCGDGVGYAGCVRAHLHCQNDKVVVMHEGRTAISRRPSLRWKPRLVVEDGDLVQPKHRRKSLRASINGSSQQRIEKVHSSLRLASSASE